MQRLASLRMTVSRSSMRIDKVVRKEWRSPHKYDGLTHSFGYGELLVRKEWRSPHEEDGCTEYYVDGELVRKEWRSPH
eukprot:3212490-Prymnesium_polylepis.1